MAVYFLRARHVSRSKGARVTRAAAYRAGECILDTRTSELYDYTHRTDVACKEILLPEDLAADPDMAWAQDRSTLWNAAEQAGKRRNSRLAREWLVLLPPELTANERAALARRFATELAERYRCAVDLTIHRPRQGADARNHHAHLLMTTREVTPQGLGNRITIEMGGRERHLRGLGNSREEYLGLRERWATLTNEALRAAGLEQRVDHRSFAAQGVDRDPTTSIPDKVFYAERRAGPSAAGDAIRARAQQRREARRRGPAELARVLAEQKAALTKQARQDLAAQRAARKAAPQTPRWSQLTRAERNAYRREQYQARRALEKQDPALEQRGREARRRAYLAFRQNHPDSARESTRRYRAAHRESVNQNQRDYRRARREQREQQREQHGPGPTPEESRANWRALREQEGPGPTAEESRRRWREMRALGPGQAPAPPVTQPGAQMDHDRDHKHDRDNDLGL